MKSKRPTVPGWYPFRWKGGQYWKAARWCVVEVWSNQSFPYELRVTSVQCFGIRFEHGAEIASMPLDRIKGGQWGERILMPGEENAQ